jgi:hypothetical protein
MNKTAILISSVFLIFSQTSCAENQKYPECKVNQPIWAKDFNKVYKVDEFYIFYSDLDSSIHKLPNPTDSNKNNIPDYVEDIATQAKSSRDIFNHAGFISLLEKPRYKNANAISIFLKKMDGNGVAYEAISKHTNTSTSVEMPCSTVMAISNNLENFPADYWTTVTHELFHLYQYGYAQFKNSWYLESLANWAERSLRLDITQATKKLNALPQTKDEIKTDIFDKNYNALWRRLFLIHSKDNLAIPEQFKTRTYTNGTKVFKDDEWRGTNLVVNIMNNLEKESERITKQENWPNYYWKESDQRSKQWDALIFNVIQKEMNKANIHEPEAQFIKTVKIKSVE